MAFVNVFGIWILSVLGLIIGSVGIVRLINGEFGIQKVSGAILMLAGAFVTIVALLHLTASI